MGKVVSAVANFVVNTVTEIVSTKVGAIVVDILAGVLLGPIGLAAATVMQKSLTEDKLKTLKQQIKQLIDLHQSEIDEANHLIQLLQKDFFDQKAFKGIVNLGQKIKGNMSAIFQNQQQKINVLTKINFIEGQKAENFSTQGDNSRILKSTLFDVGRLALDSVVLISSIASGNILSAGLAAFDIGFMTFLNIKQVFENISQIERLEAKKKQIQQYFSPGGQFDKHMDIVANYTIDIVNNLYTLAICWNNLLNQLTSWLQMVQILIPSIDKKLLSYIRTIISQSPINEQFLQKIEQLITNLNNNMVDSKGAIRVQRLFIALNNFENQNKVEECFRKITKILQKLSSDSIFYNSLENYIAGFNDINFLINQNSHLFRSQRSQDQDKIILQILNRRVKVNLKESKENQKIIQNIKKAKITTIIGCFTNKFYAQDPLGQKLFGYTLKQINNNKDMIRFLDSATGQYQGKVIRIPKPLSNYPKQVAIYNRKISLLFQFHKQKTKETLAKPEDFELYMVLQTKQYKIKNQINQRLVPYMRIQNINQPKQFYQMLNQDLIRIFDQEKNSLPVQMFLKNQTYSYQQIKESDLNSIVEKTALHIKRNLEINTVSDISIEYDANQLVPYTSKIKIDSITERNRKYIYHTKLTTIQSLKLDKYSFENRQNYIVTKIRNKNTNQKPSLGIIWIFK